jgi:uncharacterized membrane protein
VKGLGFVDAVEAERIVAAIRAAEACSSGEVRVHVTDREVEDVEGAARAQFEALGMTATRERNGILIYIAPRRRRFAVIGDQGIHGRCGPELWREVVGAMAEDFRAGRFTDGIVKGVGKAGEVLGAHFPRAQGCDINELEDAVSHD